MNDNIKIVLVDDEILFRKGISFLLEREKNIDIILKISGLWEDSVSYGITYKFLSVI